MRKRTVVGSLALSAVALVSLVLSEGYTDRAVIPVPGDVPTIGLGTTQGVKMGDTITPPQALARAMIDVNKFEGAIKRCVKVPLTQNEYDAATMFAFNIGENAFCKSTMVKKWNAGDYEGGCNEMTRWVYVKGVKIQGLVNRRERERELCLGENQ